MSGGECRVPEEIVYEILVRVPTKSILNACMAVCKSWNSLIKTHAFVLEHSRILLNNMNSQKDDILLSHSDMSKVRGRPASSKGEGEFFLLDFDEEYTSKRRVIPSCAFRAAVDSSVDPEDQGSHLIPMTTCNGLVCFELYNCRDYSKVVSITILWNPCVRKFLILPQYSESTHDVCSDPLFELGYDSLTNDLKLVKIVGPKPQYQDGKMPHRFHVFSLTKGSWKSINPPADFIPSYLDLNSVKVNGALHWICKPPFHYVHKDNIIVSFNLSTELFGRFDIPNALIKDSECRGCSQVKYIDYFALVSRSTKKDSNSFVHDLWVMKEYGVVESWTKLLTISMPCGYTYFTKSSAQVIVGTHDDGVISADLQVQGKVKVIVGDRIWISLLDPFVETLVLLDRSDAFSY